MSDEKGNVIEAARQGNPRAISTLMNRSFQPQGITATALVKDNCLLISLESSQALNPMVLTPMVQRGLNNLGITSFKTVKLYGRKPGAGPSDWIQEFDLLTDVPSQEVTNENPSAMQIAQPRSITSQRLSRKDITSPTVRTPATAKQKRNSSLLVVGIASGVVGFLLVVVAGWIALGRSAQSNAVAEAQKQVKSIVALESGQDLDTLKANQKTLQNNQKSLEAASVAINQAPKLPAFNLATVQQERENIQTQLSTIQSSMSEIDSQIKQIEQLLPVLKESVDKFSAMDSSLDVGMNYREYGSQIRDLKVALDRLKRQPGAEAHPIYKELDSAFEEYNFALNVWQDYIESDETHNFFPADSPIGDKLVSLYRVDTTKILGTEYIYLNKALRAVWARAHGYVEAAQKLS